MIIPRSIYLSIAILLLSTTEPAAQDTTRGMAKKEGFPDSQAELKYRKKWAVVVGINYSREDRAQWKDRGDITDLRRAENDARSVAQILKTKYGYEEGCVKLLLGKAATRDAIADMLMDGLFCDPKQVGPEDSVLFYFSGHGYGPGQSDSEGSEHVYLVPCDAKVDKDARLGAAHAIDLNQMVEAMGSKKCAARHRLLILDCCHSGGVFQMQGVAGGAHESEGLDASLFRTRAFQAITASRATQKASDGAASDNNSPFTAALLRALMSIPSGLSPQRPYFTANQLFSSLHAYLDAERAGGQSPQCRWLDRINAGEFHFFPDKDATFDDVSDESRRLLLTMVPSTFGNWWMEEMPWFMPGLRLNILEDHGKPRSTLIDEIDKNKLREAAQHTFNRLKSDRGLTDPQRRRLEHLRIMLDADHSLDRGAQMEAIIGQLKGVKDAGTREAVDVHYLAALQHATGKQDEAGKSYQDALDLYESESQKYPSRKALQCLCLSDFGVFQLTVRHDYDSACKLFARARKQFGLVAPVPFRIFCLTKEADAWRSKGFMGASDGRMKEALDLTRQFDKDEKHPLSAATHKQFAWSKMEQWHFGHARKEFLKSREILIKKENVDREECLIDRFHADHGLAMIHRFQGDDASTLRGYDLLIKDLHEKIQDLQQQDVGRSDVEEIRALLYNRLVNSMERHADCQLFGRHPDFASAAYYYRRALQQVDQVPESERGQVRCDLLFRRVIALCLQARGLDGSDAATKEARAFLLKQAGRQLNDAEGELESLGLKQKPIEMQLSRSIARTCLGSGEGGPGPPMAPPLPTDVGKRSNRSDVAGKSPASDQTPVEQLYFLIKELSGSKRQLDRDELERLMFAARLLMLREDCGLDSFSKLDLADLLHGLCQSSLRFSAADRESHKGLLAYLRPYYDAVFRTKTRFQPVGEKELIDLVWEATTGELTPPPTSGEPVLAMYQLGDTCHLILDVPAGRSGRFATDQGEIASVDDYRLAAESKRLLACPDALRKSLRSLKLSRGQKLWVHYHDPVLGIGDLRAGYLVLKPVSQQPAPRTGPAAPDFPFDVRSSLADPSYELGILGAIDDWQPASPPRPGPESKDERVPTAQRSP